MGFNPQRSTLPKLSAAHWNSAVNAKRFLIELKRRNVYNVAILAVACLVDRSSITL